MPAAGYLDKLFDRKLQAHRLLLTSFAMADRGCSDRIIEKLLGANLYRAFGDIWNA